MRLISKQQAKRLVHIWIAETARRWIVCSDRWSMLEEHLSDASFCNLADAMTDALDALEAKGDRAEFEAFKNGSNF